MATPMADGEITDRGRHRRIGRGRDRKLSEWTMPRECNPCSGGLALFKGRPREQQLTQPPKPKLIRHTFGRMTNNRRRCCHCANSFTSVHVIFWPLMSMGDVAAACGDADVKKACRGFKRHLPEMLVGDAKVGDLMDVEELLGCRKKLRSRREHHAAAASFMSLARLVHGLHAWLPMGGGASEDGSPTLEMHA
uniref:Uncharacterized protein n=1 Tax=Aegilops tauschii TaxID=37682 RepID=M8ARC5_AEGTA